MTLRNISIHVFLQPFWFLCHPPPPPPGVRRTPRAGPQGSFVGPQTPNMQEYDVCNPVYPGTPPVYPPTMGIVVDSLQTLPAPTDTTGPL